MLRSLTVLAGPFWRFTDVLYRAMKRAGIERPGPTGEKRTFHSLRHTYARMALESGCEIFWLSKQLGHSSVTVTVNRYGHWERKAAKRETEKLEGQFNKEARVPDEAEEELRKQVALWYEQGRKVLRLLEEGAALIPKDTFPRDKELLEKDADLMFGVAEKLKDRITPQDAERGQSS